MLKKRYLYSHLASDLKEKMVFIGGPRQVGKTTLAQFIGKNNYQHPVYLNWDFREDRKKILDEKFESEADLIIFDEIHKYKNWRNYLKGEFDKNKDRFDILVTGSARLDLYRRGGDSLLGRYHYLRLHPFSEREIMNIDPNIEIFKELRFAAYKRSNEIFDQLFQFGGFPEPFIKKDLKTLRRFHNERLDRIVREDIRDIENVRDLSALQVLVEILPGRVGSLFSANSLKEDLGVTHKTISLWLDVLERFYYHFRIYPFTSTIIRSLRKEPKVYLWDWSQIDNEAARFENMVASHLLKTIHFLYDTEGYKAELYFLRDREGREVDFLISVNKKPWMAVEVKLNNKEISKNLKYFSERLKIPFIYQVIKEKGVDFTVNGIRAISADKFLSGLV
ncbi:MAG TPA: ATP-binding protein [Patescibacteria group bacterium]|nr:ATP-binding protein [Patescibacteria group bacterium]